MSSQAVFTLVSRRGVRELENGERQGYNTYAYTESEIRRIGRVAFEAAQQRGQEAVFRG